jgi:phage-related protein
MTVKSIGVNINRNTVENMERAGLHRLLSSGYGNGIALLHGFIKKSQRTLLKDFELAKERNHKLRGKPWKTGIWEVILMIF